MHYKNGRPAQNGDKVVVIPSYGGPYAGILYSDAFEQAIDEEASKQATLKHEKTTTAEVEVTIAFQDTTNPDHGKIYDDVMKKIGEKVDGYL